MRPFSRSFKKNPAAGLRMKNSRNNRTIHLWLLLGLFLLAPINLIPNFSHISTHLPGDVMDTAEYPLKEWWTAHALVDLRVNPLFNTHMFHPMGLNMVQHTYTFLDGLFFTLLRPLLSLLVFHNLLIWMTFFINAAAAYGLIFYVTRAPGLAFIGALAFGHCPTLLSHYKTASVLESYNFIFFVLCSFGFVQKRSILRAVAAGFFWGLTLYNYPYYFVFGGLWLFLLLAYQLCPWEIRIKPQPDQKMPFWADLALWGPLPVLILFSLLAPRSLWEFLVRRHFLNWITLLSLGFVLIMFQRLLKFQAWRKISPYPSGKGEITKPSFWKTITHFPFRWNPPPLKQIGTVLSLSGLALGMAVLVGFPYFQA